MKKIAIFCVGTGGHVLPAKNIIMQLNEEGIKLENFIVITDERGSKYLKDLNIKIYIQHIYRSKIGIIGYVLNVHKVLSMLIKTRSIIKKEKVKVIFSTGSYISPAASLISFTLGIKYFGQEQNIYAGLGNKLSSLLPGVIFTSYPDTKNLFNKKGTYVGPVINQEIAKKCKDNEDNITIGIQGGSQGSSEINKYVYEFLNKNKLSDISFIHITGKDKSNDILDIKNYVQYEFVENMNSYYSKINLQISRSGGGALEAAYLGIPQILIPFKHGTTSSHQILNAEYLKSLGAAIIVNSYNQFEENLLNIINNFRVKDKAIFNTVDIEIGNQNISRHIREAFNE